MTEQTIEQGTLISVDPRTGERLGVVAPTRPDALDPVVRRAAAAFADMRWRGAPLRADALRGVAGRLRAAAAAVIATAQVETGLEPGRLSGEIERTARQLEAFAGLIAAGGQLEVTIDRADPAAQPAPRPDLRRTVVPLGPVAVFGAGNFPLAFGALGGDTASALAAGCTVVVKGHPSHPRTNVLLAGLAREALAAAGAPDDVLALVQSADVALGLALVDHPAIAAVGFTGSIAAGRALADRAAARPVPIPVFAEMGSVNPLVVSDGALLARGEEIASGLVASVTGSGGQLCTKPGLVLVPAGERGDAFVAAVAAGLAQAPAVALLDARLRDAYEAGVAELGTAARMLTPPSVPVERDGAWVRPAAFEAPASALAGAPALLHEHFGPLVVLVRWSGRAQLLDALGALDGQLTGSLHSAAEEADLRAVVVRALAARAGRLVFDGFPTGVAVTAAMQHGGPYPASTAPATTSVGLAAIGRFQRPVVFQSAPADVLPPELADDNPLGLTRRVDGRLTAEPLT